MLVATSVAALALGAVTVPASIADLAHAEPDLDERKEKVEKRIDSAADEVTESSARARRTTNRLVRAETALSDARARLAEVRRELGEARAEDDRMARRLTAAREALVEAREELARGRDDVETQRDAVTSTVVDLYTGTDPSLAALSSLLRAEDPADLTRREEAADTMVGEETRSYDDLRAAEVLLEVTETGVEEAKDLVAARREEARENLATQRRLTREQETATAEVADLVDARRSARRAADRALASDRRTLRELQAEERRITELLRRRAAAAGAATGGAPPSQGGFLNYPVNGYVTSPFGMRTHPIYGYYALHDGTDFGAPCGAPMYAGAAGTVVESYYSTSYGNRLILDHGLVSGVGVASIFNHATNYVVSPGQRVAKGQVVGYVGSTGWSTGCHLHFTVTVNGTAVDPMNWL